MKTLMIALAAIFFATFCGTTAEAKKWVGVLAVSESPLVNQVVRESGSDPAIYGPKLRKLLDSGKIKPAPGKYCLQPFKAGRPYDSKECYTTKTGIWTRWAPDHMVEDGKAMCVKVPASWPVIAGQRRYPANGGKHWNCFDFTEKASQSGYADTRQKASMIIVIRPMN